jgi:hypothetical protein
MARLHYTRIGEVLLLPCEAPARDLRGLAASLRRGKGGTRGRSVALIASGLMAI